MQSHKSIVHPVIIIIIITICQSYSRWEAAKTIQW